MIKGHNLKQKYQRGFTIVELLIVIVIIGILAALVLNSFSGVQAKARDTERSTDIRALSSQLEAYYNGTGSSNYPLVATITSDSSATTAFPGLDVNALRAPGQSANSFVTVTAATNLPTSNGTTAPSITPTASTGYTSYYYVPYNGTAASPTVCSSATACAHYVLYYLSENSPAANTWVVKSSLN